MMAGASTSVAAQQARMNQSIADFNKGISVFIERTHAAEQIVLRKFALDLLRRIVMRMPVRTGRARAGWTASADALGLKLPNAKGPWWRDESDYEEHLDGQHKSIVMINRVPYIVYLEYGSSQQAPLGFVRISMDELAKGENLKRDLIDEYKKVWDSLGQGGRYQAQANYFG